VGVGSTTIAPASPSAAACARAADWRFMASAADAAVPAAWTRKVRRVVGMGKGSAGRCGASRRRGVGVKSGWEVPLRGLGASPKLFLREDLGEAPKPRISQRHLGGWTSTPDRAGRRVRRERRRRPYGGCRRRGRENGRSGRGGPPGGGGSRGSGTDSRRRERWRHRPRQGTRDRGLFVAPRTRGPRR